MEEEFVSRRGSLRTDKKEKFQDDDKKRVRRKKKKEPLPPWTQKERYLVLFVLFATIITSAVLALSSRSWKLPNFPKISLGLHIFDSEPIIIEKSENSYPQICYDVADNIKSDFKNLTSKLTGVYGLYVIDLETGFSFFVNENETYQAASLIKLPLMASMLYESQRGKFNLSDEYILESSDKTAGSGSLINKPAGTILSYNELLTYMGKESDNTAYKASLRIVGQSRVEELMPTFGMNDTSIDKNTTTLYDVANFFDKVWHKDFLSSVNSDFLMSVITNTIYESFIPKGVPSDIAVAHKYGREVHVINDAGIVESKRPYVVVILTKGIIDAEAEVSIPEISRIVYENMQKLESI